MARRPVNPPAEGWSLTLPARLWTELASHLFQRDGAEHGAVLLAGRAEGPRGPRLLARDLIVAVDGVDYVAGRYGHRALTASFVREAAIRARDERLAYLAVHCHPGLDHVGFSPVDLASHQRGYPALVQLTGQIVGGLVFTPHAGAGDLWLPDRTRAALAEVVIPAGNLLRLHPSPAAAAAADPRWDRQARLFGDLGQHTLGRLRVAVVGVGGVGSILVELLARLGVGHLVLIDADTVDETNLPRLLGAEPDDIGKPKTPLAACNARRANPGIQLTTIQTRVEHPTARRALTGCDWIFLAADSHAARHWVNATVHQHLIPATQAGVKIPVADDGTVGMIHAVTRFLAPGSGCLWCNRLIDPTELAIEMLPDDQRDLARYVDEVPAPSVIALNDLAAAEAADHFMVAVTGLHTDDQDMGWVIHRPRTRDRDLQHPRQDPGCRWCTPAGSLGRGDSRESARSSPDEDTQDSDVPV
jgi:molybdopterin/thiamine biosynthesis adenylyltransferase